MRGGFAKVGLDAVETVAKKLTPQQRGVIFTLIGRLGREDTSVRRGKYRSGSRLTISEVADLMGWSRQYTSKQLSEIERRTGAVEVRGDGPNRHVQIAPWLANRYAPKAKRDA